jgi:hypothetical protein
MSAQPADGTEPFEVIHLGGEVAVFEDAEIEATITGHDEWAQAGRPGARSHDDVMAELLSGR